MQKGKTITENNLTKGNVLRILFTFSLPFIAANLIQALYGAVDLFVIGRYCSPESVAAVSTGTQVTQIITSMITGLTLGSTILVGKYTGMQAEEDIKKTIGTTLTIFAAAALILTAAMLLAADPILKLLKTPAPSFDLARTYVKSASAASFSSAATMPSAPSSEATATPADPCSSLPYPAPSTSSVTLPRKRSRPRRSRSGTGHHRLPGCKHDRRHPIPQPQTLYLHLPPPKPPH